MGDFEHHMRIAREKREAALEEYKAGRYTAVGDLAIKVVEQLVEALASLEGEHFHLKPREAHVRRFKWFRSKFPELATDYEVVWSAYGDLGYDGLNGKRAKEALESMERIFREIGKIRP